jgi:predicted ATP-dependent endonuclease of OLD family
MYLSKLHLKNFKCFADISINFSSHTVIHGENGSGKTSLIWACLIFLHTVKNYGSSKKYLRDFPVYIRIINDQLS